MRRRRQVLQVSTFPFLAVLLCAMGSLILLLLVMDRRAKAVAVAKARQEIARIADARAAAEAAESADAQRRRQARHEALDKEKRAVVVQLKSVRNEISKSEQQSEVLRAGYRSLQTDLQIEEKKLDKLQQALGEERGRAHEVDKQSASPSANLARLSAELRELERTLANLKALRQEQQQTYSLVPYGGKHGDTRRPIYVECASDGLIFHPDKKVLDRWELRPAAIRAEAERRIDKQRALLVKTNAKLDQRPYLLMLVRPDGIVSYYKAVAALGGLDVDYGYEFIERDWTLDFPENDEAARPQPWTTTKTTVPIATSSPANQVQRPPVRGIPSLGIPGVNSDSTVGTSPTIAAGSPASRGMATGNAGRPVLSEANPPAGPPSLPPGGSSSSGTDVMGNSLGGSGSSWSKGIDSAVPLVGTGGPGGSAGGLSSRGGSVVAGSASRPAPAERQTATLGSPGGGSGAGGSGSGRPKGPDLAVPFVGTSGGSGGSGAGGGLGGLGGPSLPGAPAAAGLTSLTAPARAGIQSPTLPTGGGVQPGTSGAPSSARSILEVQGPVVGGHGGTAPSAVAGSQTTGVARGGAGTNAESLAGSNPEAADQHHGTSEGSPSPTPPWPAAGAGSWVATTKQGQSAAGNAPAGISGTPGAGDGGGSGSGGLPIDPRLLADKKSQPRLPLYTRLTGGRDWIITIECLTDGVVLRPLGQHFGVESLTEGAGEENALSRAVKEMIERRQASVRPGEMPYRPQIRFLVKPPEGLRSYYAAYPALENLRLTMTRENLDPVHESKLPPRRKE